MKNNISPWRAFWVATLFIAATDMIFIRINYQAAWETLEHEIHHRKEHLRAAFEISLTSTATNMQQIATYIANDGMIPQLFLKGKKAVEKEGGGSGGQKAAKIREQLYLQVKNGWTKMTKSYDVRQLHFHLPPGSISFLRVHKPGAFGDAMNQVRYTVVDTNRSKQPVKGFETGRVYSGIRGVVPVFATDPDTGKEVHVGALEAGTSMTILLDHLKTAAGYELAAFLTKSHLERNVWPQFLKWRLENKSFGDALVLESATTRDLSVLNKSSVLNTITREGIIIIRKSSTALMAFPFKDYHQSMLADGAPVGYIVAWQDIAPEIQAIRKGLRVNMIYGVMIFCLVEAILYFSWRLGISGLQSAIKKSTQDLEETNRRLSREMNERKTAEQKFTAIFENAPVGILQYGRGNAITSMNPECARLFGFSSLERMQHAIQNDFLNLFPDRETHLRFNQQLMQKGIIDNFEYAMATAVGDDPVWLSISARISGPTDAEEGFFTDCFIRDVSGYRKLEKLKEEVDQMTRHDLKGPLNGIINLPTLIRMENGLSTEQERMLERIEQAGFRMIQMINMSLSLYRMETGTYVLSPKDLDLHALIKKVILEMEGFSSRKNIEICFEDRDVTSEKEIIPGEEIILFSLFQNLIQNAVESSPEDGMISITIEPAGQMLSVNIQNQGEVPEEIKPRFFDKYATSGKKNGTGLGTYSAKLFARIHGGDIKVFSGPDCGTVVTVCLPRPPMPS